MTPETDHALDEVHGEGLVGGNDNAGGQALTVLNLDSVPGDAYSIAGTLGAVPAASGTTMKITTA